MGRIDGWRLTFVVVAALALLRAMLIALYAPRDRTIAGARPLRELGALKRSQVWLTLVTGAIGFGGIFAVYTYLGSTLIDGAHVSAAMAALVFSVFGIAMIGAGFGLTSTSYIGCALAVGGLAVWGISRARSA
jgi:DHA1 family inner membrane transport protein